MVFEVQVTPAYHWYQRYQIEKQPITGTRSINNKNLPQVLEVLIKTTYH